MKCVLISATDKLEEENLSGVFVQSVAGELGFLRGHLPMIVKLKDNSLIRLKTAGAPKYYAVGRNTFLHFSNDEAVVLTRSFARTQNF